MAKVKTITVGIETSIKLAEYQYIKPRIDLTYRLDDGEQAGTVMAEARDRLVIEMAKLEAMVRENVPGKAKSKNRVEDTEMPY
jgi:hypothetical protein